FLAFVKIEGAAACFVQFESDVVHRQRDLRQGRKYLFDLRTPGFVAWRQHKVSTEFLDGFVDGKPGIIGSDLEQHATRLTEVNREEVVAVDLWRYVQSPLIHLFPYFFLCFFVLNPERNVVNCPRCSYAGRLLRGLEKIYRCCGGDGPRDITVAVALFSCQFISQHFCKNGSCVFNGSQHERRAM